jgi:tripartite-type tricarboxylate transporter receptor subunit TctC
MVAANHLYNAAAKDGLIAGIFPEVQVMSQLTSMDGVQFDLRKFNWLGSSFADPNVCIVRSDAAGSSFKELIGGAKPIAVGATGPGSNTYDVPRVFAAATGANLKTVAGYPTSNEVRIGVERGELQGICYGWESVKSAADQWLRDKYVRVIVQNGPTRHKDLPDVPLVAEFAKDEESKTMLRLVDAPGAMAKAFVVPPGVDAGRVQVLRAALQATYKDPAFLEEAAAMKLDIQPKTAEEIQQLLNEVLSTPPELAAKYKKIVEPT